MAEINPAVVRWFEGRGIGHETILRCGIFSGMRATSGDDGAMSVVQREDGNIICFPYFEGGVVVAEKYRAAGKRFFQKPGCRKTFFNAEILADANLQDGMYPLVICEGEMDCLSLLEAGYPFAVSVPDGAPPARDGNGNLIEVPDGADDIDPSNDEKFRYVFNNWEKLKRVKKIIIATDNDDPGRRLAAELVRRLGRVRCCFVVWPDQCKDMNDVLLKYGAAEVHRLIQTAKEYPVSGVYRYSDLPSEPDIFAVSSGWTQLDQFIMLYHPAFMVVTGRAGHGKSCWTQQLVCNLAAANGWNVAIASFEMRIKPFVADALKSAFLGIGKLDWSRDESMSADAFIEDRFCFIAPEPDSERSHDIDWLLEKAEAAVIRHAARVLLIDPWNEIEHARRSNETTTEYTNRAIIALKNFGRRFDVLVIVVAHPTKSGAAKDASDLTLYDISDSAAFQNKADLGVVIARLGDPAIDKITGVFIKKVRYQPECGTLGNAELAFDARARIFV